MGLDREAPVASNHGDRPRIAQDTARPVHRRYSGLPAFLRLRLGRRPDDSRSCIVPLHSGSPQAERWPVWQFPGAAGGVGG